MQQNPNPNLTFVQGIFTKYVSALLHNCLTARHATYYPTFPRFNVFTFDQLLHNSNETSIIFIPKG